ncbi:hypothetical protein SAMD00019534_010740 [Acytostelium subglobosum LB1]|uniref:hypothetical protein n=1 Tax=Acytostelium subglobosum LB1 TaxID=1410327 RepID=UPI000644B818|nr:hypothetical protein SAMD00019534_010740 [Acytostelium subglobosum LB1]GAM17899.1 hypothetical protein SAMD00019534_010740 [Acytostelium subglobosum LB1]|eukprot:XP_012758495.1 hypothetical protein SAMD00019534_010740 [Acytostelium subglobosum LB1]
MGKYLVAIILVLFIVHIEGNTDDDCHTPCVSCKCDDDCPSDNRCNVGSCVAGRCTIKHVTCPPTRCGANGTCSTETGKCMYKPMNPYCCDDGNACTRDSFDQCLGCENIPIAGCCTSDNQCQATANCTTSTCVNNKCVAKPIPGCCTCDGECSDGNICTRNTCDSGRCNSVQIPGCCKTSQECPSNKCQTGHCSDNRCTYTSTGLCCKSDAGCRDLDVCTKDTCNSDGSCSHTPIPGCCVLDSQCPHDDCNIGFCGKDNQCHSRPNPACCTCNDDCNDGRNCTVDVCRNGKCEHSKYECPTYSDCCLARCTGYGSCDQSFIPGCVDDGESEHCDDNNACTYDKYDCLKGCLNIPRSCDDHNRCTTDSCSSVTGCVHTVIPGCCTCDDDCDDHNSCTVDSCTTSGQCIHTPIPGCCQSDNNCYDGNNCTIDTCYRGKCVHAQISGCCTCDSECNDNNLCSDDYCQANKCIHKDNGQCCLYDSDCRTNGDLCDTSTCVNKRCQRRTMDCDDGLPCTNDFCQEGKCKHTCKTCL